MHVVKIKEIQEREDFFLGRGTGLYIQAAIDPFEFPKLKGRGDPQHAGGCGMRAKEQIYQAPAVDLFL